MLNLCDMLKAYIQFSSVQSLSHVQLFEAPWIAVCQASLSITNSWSSLGLKSIESMMPSSHLILCRPVDVDNLISGSSAYSKSSLYIWKFSIHVVLKPSLKDFQHYLASMWNESNCVVVWAFFGTGMKMDLFQFCGHCWVFQMCWHIECSTLKASSFRIWNNSAGIPSPPLALFVVMLPKPNDFMFQDVWL